MWSRSLKAAQKACDLAKERPKHSSNYRDYFLNRQSKLLYAKDHYARAKPILEWIEREFANVAAECGVEAPRRVSFEHELNKVRDQRIAD